LDLKMEEFEWTGALKDALSLFALAP